jgi:hypothetical protein
LALTAPLLQAELTGRRTSEEAMETATDSQQPTTTANSALAPAKRLKACLEPLSASPAHQSLQAYDVS